MAEAGDGRTALEIIEMQAPDVVLLDISMPGLGGIETLRKITREHPAVKVIILSVHSGDEYVIRALRAGASGYLVKGAASAELELALRAVRRGECYLSPVISKLVIGWMLRGSPPAEGALAQLTERQREILKLLAEGAGTKEVAQILGISVKTVETHRAQLMERLGIHDLAGLVRFAIRNGLVSAEL